MFIDKEALSHLSCLESSFEMNREDMHVWIWFARQTRLAIILFVSAPETGHRNNIEHYPAIYSRPTRVTTSPCRSIDGSELSRSKSHFLRSNIEYRNHILHENIPEDVEAAEIWLNCHDTSAVTKSDNQVQTIDPEKLL